MPYKGVEFGECRSLATRRPTRPGADDAPLSDRRGNRLADPLSGLSALRSHSAGWLFGGTLPAGRAPHLHPGGLRLIRSSGELWTGHSTNMIKRRDLIGCGGRRSGRSRGGAARSEVQTPRCAGPHRRGDIEPGWRHRRVEQTRRAAAAGLPRFLAGRTTCVQRRWTATTSRSRRLAIWTAGRGASTGSDGSAPEPTSSVGVGTPIQARGPWWAEQRVTWGSARRAGLKDGSPPWTRAFGSTPIRVQGPGEVPQDEVDAYRGNARVSRREWLERGWPSRESRARFRANAVGRR